MALQHFNSELFEFLKFSSTPFHAVQYLNDLFLEAGFKKLQEKDEWKTSPGNGYFCIRDTGSVLAFKLADTKQQNDTWKMLAAHTDSPSLQIKPQPETTSNNFTQLGVEVYGGPILSTWFDRDLGIAGRVTLLDHENRILSKNIDFKRPIAVVPNLAIHLNREVNNEYSINRQKHLLPLICQTEDNDYSFHDTLLQQIQQEHPKLTSTKLLGFDLFCYDTQPPSITGLNGEFISASRLDNLVSCFIGAKAILENTSGNCLLLCSNHEEIGSSTVAGAQGNFLSTVLKRLEPEETKRTRKLSESQLISMDNAHGLHPNFPEKHDPQHLPILNHGPVIKYNANQRYASTSLSAALFKILCAESDIPTQEFVMHNDLRCGSTIGPIAATSLGIQTVDVGIPSLAMHSIRETTGVKDPYMLFTAISRFLTCTKLPRVTL
jgi:aspartyl aminopeptidase